MKCCLNKIVAAALVFSTLVITTPVSAADFTTSKSVIGSVSALGQVELRGVGITQEGTVFAGDRIRSGQKGYAKVLLGTTGQIELIGQTDVSVDRDAQGIKIAMNTGAVGFTAKTPLRIDFMPFEITASDGAAGHVAVRTGSAGIRAITGKVTVRNLKTSETFIVEKGQERLVGLQAPPLAQVASRAPSPIPAPVPAPAPRRQTPAGQTSTGGIAMDTGAWIAVIGGGAVAGIAIWGLVTALNNNDDIDDLQDQINRLRASPSR